MQSVFRKRGVLHRSCTQMQNLLLTSGLGLGRKAFECPLQLPQSKNTFVDLRRHDGKFYLLVATKACSASWLIRIEV